MGIFLIWQTIWLIHPSTTDNQQPTKNLVLNKSIFHLLKYQFIFEYDNNFFEFITQKHSFGLIYFILFQNQLVTSSSILFILQSVHVSNRFHYRNLYIQIQYPRTHVRHMNSIFSGNTKIMTNVHPPRLPQHNILKCDDRHDFTLTVL